MKDGKPKKGELWITDGTHQFRQLILYIEDYFVVPQNERLATPEGLAGMGLVTLAEYKTLRTRYLDLYGEVEKLSDFAYKQEDKKQVEPQPKTFSGKYKNVYSKKVVEIIEETFNDVIFKDTEGEKGLLSHRDFQSQFVRDEEPQPTHRFKVGDKVRLVKKSNWRDTRIPTDANVGSIGIITRVVTEFSWDYEVTSNNKFELRWMDCDLELVTEEKPDWIKEGNLVYRFEGYIRKITKVTDYWVSFKKGEDAKLQHVIENYHHFTPPPMPIRLGWGLCDDGNLEFMGIQNTLEAWIPFVEEITGWTDALKWLLELQEWRKKWGTQ